MTKIVLTETFVGSTTQVQTKSKRNEIYKTIRLLETTPCLGSSRLPASILARFGNSVRKLAVNPFEIIYEYDVKQDTVFIYDVVHQRGLW